MIPRFSSLLRTSSFPMARVLPRASPVPLSPATNTIAFIRLPSHLGFASNANRFGVSPSRKPSLSGGSEFQGLRPLGGRVWASQREYRKVRRRAAKSKEKELELNVSICIEEDLPDDPELLVLSISLFHFALLFELAVLILTWNYV
jgi:hypothetical protein